MKGGSASVCLVGLHENDYCLFEHSLRGNY